MSRSRLITLIIIAVAVIAGVSWGINYLNSTYTLHVSYGHVHNVQVIDASHSDQDSGSSKVVATLTKSPSDIRLSKNNSYRVVYQGDSGYADGGIAVDPAKPTVNIDPEYSDEKYATMMSTATPIVHDILLKKYPKIDQLYTLKAVGMKNKGEWLTALLVFTGQEDFNTDTLRALFKKDGNSWKLVAGPDIIFTTVKNKGIDLPILDWANNLSE